MIDSMTFWQQKLCDRLQCDRLQWQEGRQNTGYKKITLFTLSRPINCDGYLICYPIGSSVPVHKDTVTHKRHYRLNIIVRHARVGGEFICAKSIINLPRLKLFRPDKYSHEVTQVLSNTRYVLSFGLAVSR